MNKIETTATYTIPTDAVVVGLCAGRHDMPVEEFIFPQVVDPPPSALLGRLSRSPGVCVGRPIKPIAIIAQ